MYKILTVISIVGVALFHHGALHANRVNNGRLSPKAITVYTSCNEIRGSSGVPIIIECDFGEQTPVGRLVPIRKTSTRRLSGLVSATRPSTAVSIDTALDEEVVLTVDSDNSTGGHSLIEGLQMPQMIRMESPDSFSKYYLTDADGPFGNWTVQAHWLENGKEIAASNTIQVVCIRKVERKE